MLPDKITVQVDCTEGEVSRQIYTDIEDCYVARALKQAGYNVFSAGSSHGGLLLIDTGGYCVRYKYDPPFEMLFTTFIKAFENKEVLIINMTKI